MNWADKTIKTYDKSASGMEEYFGSKGARIFDIELGLKLAKVSDSARVVEIGCGDGRDAYELFKRVSWYEGFDPSIELLKLARRKVPGASFVLADALSYEYPQKLDVVYAFASLLHVNKSDLGVVLKNLHKSLRKGGIIYLSLKERDRYVEEVKSDSFGDRMFYYYTPQLVTRIAGNQFSVVYEDHQHIGGVDWFTLALVKL